MQFDPASYTASPIELASRFAQLFPEYAPGTETGPAAPTDLRACWIKSIRHLLETMGHEYGLQVCGEERGDVTARKQLRMYWKKGDAITLAAFSGWGDRDDLERAFHALETLKAPQKIIIYTCARWQEAVLDQLSAALQRYPDHIAGEQYIALNVLPAESRLYVHTSQIKASGRQDAMQATLRPLTGSPFATVSQRHRQASQKGC